MKWLALLKSMTQDEITDISRGFSSNSTQFDNGFMQWKGYGPLVESFDGKQAYDFSSGVGSKNAGQHNKRLAAVKQWFAENEISNLPDHDFPHPIVALLKRELTRLTPGNFPKKVFMGRGGAEANEHAIKLAKVYRPNGYDFAFVNSFHGRSTGALRFTSSKNVQWSGFVNQSDRPTFLPFPHKEHSCSKYRNALLQDAPRNTLQHPRLLFLECVQGEGGINVACYYCLRYVVSLFQRLGALIVADEVQSGFWRTGKPLAYNWYDIEPDIVSFGKSLCPSHSLSASVFRASLDFTVPGRNSNTGVDAEACAVALEMIELMKELDPRTIKANVALLSRVAPQGLGLMRRIECENKAQRDAIIDAAVRHDPIGLILLGTGSERLGEHYIRLMPPVTVTAQELTEMIAILRSVCEPFGLQLPE